MSGFRYPQFCALARAAEILCERWNLLIIRELLFGPQRFSDLRRGLSEVSPSVLSQRLAALEAAGVIRKTMLEPPAASTVYELAEAGQSLMPAIRELGRWGARYLMPPETGELADASMLGFYLRLLAAREPTPQVRLNVRTRDEDREYVFHVCGGKSGTDVADGERKADATISGAPIDVLAVAGRYADFAEATAAGRIRVSGGRSSASQFAELFMSYFPIDPPRRQQPQPTPQGESKR